MTPEQQIEADRAEAFDRSHAGQRFERRNGTFEDGRGETAEPFDADVTWPERQAADLARWGYGEVPSWVERNRAETAAFRAKWGI
jgi:hypothetical protein